MIKNHNLFLYFIAFAVDHTTFLSPKLEKNKNDKMIKMIKLEKNKNVTDHWCRYLTWTGTVDMLGLERRNIIRLFTKLNVKYIVQVL